MNPEVFVCLSHDKRNVVLQSIDGVEVSILLSNKDAQQLSRALLETAANIRTREPRSRCEMCKKIVDSGWRYCSTKCRRGLIRRMENSEYLRPVPKHVYPQPDKPGFRACSENSWDDAVKAIEDGQ